MERKKRIVLYVSGLLAYGLVVFVVYLYVTFPYDLVRHRLIEQFDQRGVRLTIQDVRPGWLPGLHLRRVRVLADEQEIPGALLQLQALRIRPASLPLLSERWRVRLAGTLYDGQLQGTVRLPSGNGTGTWDVAGRFDGLQIGQHAFLQRQDEPFLRGSMAGAVEMAWERQGQVRQGTVDLQLDTVIFDGQSLQLPIQRDITCDSVQAQIRITPQLMQLMSFTCQGNDLTLEARGTVNLRQPLDQSELRLLIQLQSETVYSQEIALLGNLINRRPDRRGMLQFSIRGTIQQPRLGA